MTDCTKNAQAGFNCCENGRPVEKVIEIIIQVSRNGQFESNRNRSCAGYRSLIQTVDSLSRNLEKVHSAHMSCRPECTDCCRVARTVFPVEAVVLIQAIDKNLNALPAMRDSESDCAFLVNNLCAVYSARPIICRTHGFPLLIATAQEMGISYCELNFSKWPKNQGFAKNQILDTLALNQRLRTLNQIFIEEFVETATDPDLRIPVSDLIGVLRQNSREGKETGLTKKSQE